MQRTEWNSLVVLVPNYQPIKPCCSKSSLPNITTNNLIAVNKMVSQVPVYLCHKILRLCPAAVPFFWVVLWSREPFSAKGKISGKEDG